jgi:hypothetical protein
MNPTTEEVAIALGVSLEVAREYLMERRYHGVSHEEALRRAQESPWAK